MLRFCGVRLKSNLHHLFAFLVLTACCWLLFFHHLDRRSLSSSHEGRAGQHAKMMLDSGRWDMPVLYWGYSDHQKPPLFYWLVTGTSWLRGTVVDAWSVRLPSAASALLGVWLIYAVASSIWGRTVGFLSAVTLSTTLRYCWLARVGRIDMPLTLVVSIALTCFWFAYCRICGIRCLLDPSSPHRTTTTQVDNTDSTQSRITLHTIRCESPAHSDGVVWPWLLCFYFSISAAILLKGPVGAVLPCAAILMFLMLEGQLTWPWKRRLGRVVKATGLLWGAPFVVLVAGTWYVWATVVTNGQFFEVFFLHHNLDRTVGARGLKTEPFWYYVPQLFYDLFPWSVLLPVAGVTALRSERNGRGAFTRYAFSWVAGMLALLSVVRFKRHDYLLPLIPGCALLLGGFWHRLLCHRTKSSLWIWPRILAWSSAVFGGMVVVAIATLRHPSLARSLLNLDLLSGFVTSSTVAMLSHLQLSFGKTQLGVTFCLGTILLGTYLGVCALRGCWPVLGTSMIALVWVAAFLLYVDYIIPSLEPMRSQKSLAGLARQLSPKGQTIYYYGREDHQMLFYLGLPVQRLRNRTWLREVITRQGPVFVIAELNRFVQRQREWPDVTMLPIARNTDNFCGTHICPMVLITNMEGWRTVQELRLTGHAATN